jgi:hypothetical protein
MAHAGPTTIDVLFGCAKVRSLRRTRPRTEYKEAVVTNLFRIALPFLAAAALAACSEAPPTPEVQTGSSPVRPDNPAANLPSDSGAQTTLPSGAVTGAGQPQGTVAQPDVGSGGGLEQRARQDERAGGDSAARVEDGPDGGRKAPAAQLAR